MIVLIVGILCILFGVVFLIGGVLLYTQAKKKYRFSERSFMISFGVNPHTDNIFTYFNCSLENIRDKFLHASPESRTNYTDALLNIGFDGGEILGLATLGLKEIAKIQGGR